MYKLFKDKWVIRLIDNACIPMDEANVDFQQYQVWISEGNIPLPADSIASTQDEGINAT
jgi:hypothetical protein